MTIELGPSEKVKPPKLSEQEEAELLREQLIARFDGSYSIIFPEDLGHIPTEQEALELIQDAT